MAADLSPEGVERLALRCYAAADAFRRRVPNCCGEKDSTGTCAAPACYFGDILGALFGSEATLRALAAEVARLRSEIRVILDAADQSQWHDRAGEKVKRITFAPSAIDRLRQIAEGYSP